MVTPSRQYLVLTIACLTSLVIADLNVEVKALIQEPTKAWIAGDRPANSGKQQSARLELPGSELEVA
ncbi:hypothetical protein HIV01_001090 [Lysobacter arenosi]|uniref:Uncharacterized protein n=1 Tax=Lysobacter arenosi TaxID=2795387 RepID=A0ABX7RCR2_9GAMM|nr:hypothetical protein [Lysobacter arenosi]QSX75197.1 hypothetical protein HIV01_001090 [Lysobacter arenosi]